MKKALFLDRDGTIIEDHGYMRDPDLVRLLPGAAEILRELGAENWTLIVIGNQSGVGRGIIAPAEMDAVQSRFLDVMREESIRITASYFCPHRPDEHCECRKPLPFHVELAAREYDLDPRQSWMIGDRESDVLCGKNAGCGTIWLRNTAHFVPEDQADFTAQRWSEIARIVRSQPPVASMETYRPVTP